MKFERQWLQQFSANFMVLLCFHNVVLIRIRLSVFYFYFFTKIPARDVGSICNSGGGEGEISKGAFHLHCYWCQIGDRWDAGT